MSSVVLLYLVICTPTFADPLDDANAAVRRGDFAAAFAIWKPLADAGDSAAQNGIGLLYYDGNGMPRPNKSEALKWFKLSAAQGNARAINNLGLIYEFGGGGIKPDEIEAQRLYQIAADKGERQAQFNVGAAYWQGWRGVKKDSVQAAKWFQLAADQGLARAQDLLGDMYRHGDGVQKNYDTALVLYKSAALHDGWWEVQRKLGRIYNGDIPSGNLKQDRVKALMWFSLSPVLKADADNLERLMPPDQAQFAKAMAERCLQSNYTECE